jgi:glucan 1,3-beta-glucosidase
VTLNKAKNVFIGLQEGEAAYYQGTGNNLPAPAPWKESLLPTDPDFSWCAANGVMVRAACFGGKLELNRPRSVK